MAKIISQRYLVTDKVQEIYPLTKDALLSTKWKTHIKEEDTGMRKEEDNLPWAPQRRHAIINQRINPIVDIIVKRDPSSVP